MGNGGQNPNWEWIAQQVHAMQFSVEMRDLDGIRIGIYTLLEALEQWKPQKPDGIDRLFGPLVKRQQGQHQGE